MMMPPSGLQPQMAAMPRGLPQGRGARRSKPLRPEQPRRPPVASTAAAAISGSSDSDSSSSSSLPGAPKCPKGVVELAQLALPPPQPTLPPPVPTLLAPPAPVPLALTEGRPAEPAAAAVAPEPPPRPVLDELVPMPGAPRGGGPPQGAPVFVAPRTPPDATGAEAMEEASLQDGVMGVFVHDASLANAGTHAAAHDALMAVDDEEVLPPQPKARPEPGKISFNITGAKQAMSLAKEKAEAEAALAAARARRLNTRDASTQTVRDPETQDGDIVTVWRLRPRGMESFPHFPRQEKRKRHLNNENLITAIDDTAASVVKGRAPKQNRRGSRNGDAEHVLESPERSPAAVRVSLQGNPPAMDTVQASQENKPPAVDVVRVSLQGQQPGVDVVAIDAEVEPDPNTLRSSGSREAAPHIAVDASAAVDLSPAGTAAPALEIPAQLQLPRKSEPPPAAS